MGYITDFKLELIGESDKVSEFKATLIKKVEEADDEYVDDVEVLLEYGTVYGKLYDLEDWIYYAAKENPDVLVILNGDGEGSDDVWELRIKGETSEKLYAQIPPFTNPELMVPTDKN